MKKPEITKECIKDAFQSRYIKVYDIEYDKGQHYLDASRRNKEDLVAVKTDDEFRNMLPDAVTICLILTFEDGTERLLMNYEYRYPAGRFLLSPPAGLIDPEDYKEDNPLIKTAIREVKEETGITIRDKDEVKVLYPLLFSSPGMTDESNAIVLARVNAKEMLSISQEGALGSECFNGYKLIDKKEAQTLLAKGVDEFGNFFSVFTCIILQYFLSV